MYMIIEKKMKEICMAANVENLKLPPPMNEAEALDPEREDYELWREAVHKRLVNSTCTILLM